MSGRFFLDTNILVYTFDSSAPAKKAKASSLVEEALKHQRGIISSQVLQEFLNVATRKFTRPFSHDDCRLYLDQVLAPLCEMFPSIELYRRALHITARWNYSLYDALILAAALEGGCRVLYTEDLHHGQQIENLTICDPFHPAAAAP